VKWKGNLLFWGPEGEKRTPTRIRNAASTRVQKSRKRKRKKKFPLLAHRESSERAAQGVPKRVSRGLGKKNLEEVKEGTREGVFSLEGRDQQPSCCSRGKGEPGERTPRKED